jgi:hypothetical protein
MPNAIHTKVKQGERKELHLNLFGRHHVKAKILISNPAAPFRRFPHMPTKGLRKPGQIGPSDTAVTSRSGKVGEDGVLSDAEICLRSDVVGFWDVRRHYPRTR